MGAPLAFRRAVKAARRLAPVAVELKRRWDRMSPEEKARHRERALRAADRAREAGRDAAKRVRKRRER